MPENEVWKAIPGYEGLYEVSNLGRVKRIKKYLAQPGILKLNHTNRGYVNVCLSQNGNAQTHRVHKLVIEAFFGPRPEGMQVNHKDGDKSNNRIENLEWLTPSENIRHSLDVLGNPKSIPPVFNGDNHPQSKLTWDDVRQIRFRYWVEETPSRKLAKMYQVSKTTILNVVNYRIWREQSE